MMRRANQSRITIALAVLAAWGLGEFAWGAGPAARKPAGGAGKQPRAVAPGEAAPGAAKPGQQDNPPANPKNPAPALDLQYNLVLCNVAFSPKINIQMPKDTNVKGSVPGILMGFAMSYFPKDRQSKMFTLEQMAESGDELKKAAIKKKSGIILQVTVTDFVLHGQRSDFRAVHQLLVNRNGAWQVVNEGTWADKNSPTITFWNLREKVLTLVNIGGGNLFVGGNRHSAGIVLSRLTEAGATAKIKSFRRLPKDVGADAFEITLEVKNTMPFSVGDLELQAWPKNKPNDASRVMSLHDKLVVGAGETTEITVVGHGKLVAPATHVFGIKFTRIVGQVDERAEARQFQAEFRVLLQKALKLNDLTFEQKHELFRMKASRPTPEGVKNPTDADLKQAYRQAIDRIRQLLTPEQLKAIEVQSK